MTSNLRTFAPQFLKRCINVVNSTERLSFQKHLKYSLRFCSSENNDSKTKPRFPSKYPASRRVSVTQRIASMLPNNFIDETLDSEEKRVIKDLLGAEKDENGAKSTEKGVTTVHSDHSAEPGVRMEPVAALAPPMASRATDAATRGDSLLTLVSLQPSKPPFTKQFILNREVDLKTDFGIVSHEQIKKMREGEVLRVSNDAGTVLLVTRKVNCEVFLKVQMKLLKAGLRARVGMMREDDLVMMHPRDTVLLAHMLDIEKGQRVLEVGTGFGGSMIKLSQILSESGHVTSLEKLSSVYDVAKENLDAWKESKGGDEDGGDNITLSLCDACDSQQLENVLSKNGPDNSTSEGNSVETILPFDAIFLDLTGPEHVFKNVLPYLKLGGAVGIMARNLNSILSVNKFIMKNRIPLHQEKIIEPSEKSWIIHARTEERKDLLCRPERVDPKWGFPFTSSPVWLVRLTKVASFDLVREAVRGERHFEAVGTTIGEDLARIKRKFNL